MRCHIFSSVFSCNMVREKLEVVGILSPDFHTLLSSLLCIYATSRKTHTHTRFLPYWHGSLSWDFNCRLQNRPIWAKFRGGLDWSSCSLWSFEWEANKKTQGICTFYTIYPQLLSTSVWEQYRMWSHFHFMLHCPIWVSHIAEIVASLGDKEMKQTMYDAQWSKFRNSVRPSTPFQTHP